MTLKVSISNVEWFFLHDMGEKSTLVDFFSIECRKREYKKGSSYNNNPLLPPHAFPIIYLSPYSF